MFHLNKAMGLLVGWLLFNSAGLARDWEELALAEFAQVVKEQATDSELGELAQKQFYFEIHDDHDERIQDYLDLQLAISLRIPVEFDRPVFDIRVFYGSQTELVADKTIGILGGTGPVSDASILNLVHDQLPDAARQDEMAIHLFSLPPPRDTWDQISGGPLYLARLTRFLTHSYSSYYLASNTAHLNLETIQLLAGGRVQNLVARVASQLSENMALNNPDSSVLILGTSQAWEGKLYDSYFDELGVRYHLLDETNQDQIQLAIDNIKSGSWTSEQAFALYSWIKELGHSSGAKYLLLSCTELPLGLANYIRSLEDDGFIVADTEKMFALLIAADLLVLAT